MTYEHGKKGIKVVSLNISKEKGTIKIPVNDFKIDERGVIGDAHAGHWHRQVSLLAKESILKIGIKHNRIFKNGEFAENVTTEGIELINISLLDRFKIRDILLEVTQKGKKCHSGCEIFKEVGDCIMPKEGIFCRVLSTGEVKKGDTIEYLKKLLKIKIITLSDRASTGEYKDKSGPIIKQLVADFFNSTSWHISIETNILPDNPEKLKDEILKSVDKKTDIIITSGGTGIGPKDFTPYVVGPLCDKFIPGIMEHIRLKYGKDQPNALLSRSIAGIKKYSLIYTLPGSPRAVREYMKEIFPTLEHSILMLHGIGH